MLAVHAMKIHPPQLYMLVIQSCYEPARKVPRLREFLLNSLQKDTVYEISKVIGPSIYKIWDPTRNVDLGNYHVEDLIMYHKDPAEEEFPPLPVLRKKKRGRQRNIPSDSCKASQLKLFR